MKKKEYWDKFKNKKDLIEKDHLGGYKLKCTKCGNDNKSDALFCKKCGFNLKNDNIINRINSKINLLAVLIGLCVAVIILITCAFLFIGIAKNYSLPFYIGIVLFTMALIGSIFTGAFGNDNANDGMINGGILSLVILLFTSFMVGIILLAFIGIGSIIASSFGSGASSSALINSTTSSTSGSDASGAILFLVKFIVGIIAIFVAGMLGGTFGVYIKEALS